MLPNWIQTWTISWSILFNLTSLIRFNEDSTYDAVLCLTSVTHLCTASHDSNASPQHVWAQCAMNYHRPPTFATKHCHHKFGSDTQLSTSRPTSSISQPHQCWCQPTSSSSFSHNPSQHCESVVEQFQSHCARLYATSDTLLAVCEVITGGFVSIIRIWSTKWGRHFNRDTMTDCHFYVSANDDGGLNYLIFCMDRLVCIYLETD